MDVFAPLSSEPIRVTVSEYGAPNFDFVFVPYEDTTAWWSPLVRLSQWPRLIVKMTAFVWRHEVLLIRSPGHFGLVAHLLAFILRKKSVTKYAGNFSYFEGERLPSIIERNFIRRILRPPHYVLIYGRSDASHLISFIPAAISGPEIAALRSLKKERIYFHGKAIFYSLGKLMPVKNFELAIHGLGLLYREHPELEWEYHLIGDGETKRLMDLCQDYKIADRVIFEGKLSYDAAMRKLVTADFVIMPGLKEGWPKVVIEGWAVGAVPITASAGLMSQIIVDGENGFIFEPTPTALKEKIVFILSNKAMVESIKARSLEFCQSYSLEKFKEMAFLVCSEKLHLRTK